MTRFYRKCRWWLTSRLRRTDETADLRMAIVRQAADDYIRAKKLLKIQPDN